MRRRTLALALALGLLLTAAGSATARAASLSLRPALATNGADVAVEGAGWPANRAVTVRRRGGAVLLRAVAGRDGRFTGSLRVPRSLKVRTHPLIATGAARRRVDATLRVVAATRDWAPRQIALSTGVRFDLSRSVAFPGAPVRVDVRGLREGDTV